MEVAAGCGGGGSMLVKLHNGAFLGLLWLVGFAGEMPWGLFFVKASKWLMALASLPSSFDILAMLGEIGGGQKMHNWALFLDLQNLL